ncbi:putative bifunctional diguanylate cyclase/phosphodiesterase [Geodermatophilus sp. SYSU D00703]
MGRDPAQPTAVARTVVVGAAAVVLAWAAASVWLPEGVVSRAVSDLAQLTAAAAATGTTAWRAVRSAGRLRATWAAFSLACAGWAAGQAYWTTASLSGWSVPFPSMADAGFLAFPLFAAVGLLLHPADDGVRGRRQRASDAMMTSAAVGLVSWQTALEAVVAERATNDPLETLLLVAYPVLDVLLVVMTVLTLASSRRRGADLVLVGAGLVGLSVSDSAFVFLQATGTYDGGLVDGGWVLAFLALCVAGVLRGPGTPGGAVRAPGRGVRTTFLPYVPVAVALTSSLTVTLVGRPLGRAEMLLATVVIALLLTRQCVALRENVRLADELAAREAMLRHQAFHDGLTGLANRALFRDRLHHALQLHTRDLRPVSVVFLDLDDFKVVNDTLGHATGDELLVQVAERLREAVRAGDTVARLGGDEFAVLLEDGADTPATTARLLETLRAPFSVGGRSLLVRASVGVSTLGAADATVDVDELLVRSDLAMYAAKRAGKDQVVSYTHGLNLLEVEEGELRDRLFAAIAAREIGLEYQPIVELGTHRVVALEALARWRPDGIEVGPDVFVPLVERVGLIDELTVHLLGEACARVAEWSADRGTPVAVHANVAPSSLAAPAFVAAVGDLVTRHGLAPGQLVLELTERCLLDDPETAERELARLRARGVGICLDDFGVGQSSLARLRTLPLDSMKVDRSFLGRTDSDPREATLLGAVLRLARDIGLPVVAEGVERPGQLATLRGLGCPRAQGYLLGRPVSASAVPGLLDGSAVLTG